MDDTEEGMKPGTLDGEVEAISVNDEQKVRNGNHEREAIGVGA